MNTVAIPTAELRQLGHRAHDLVGYEMEAARSRA